MNVVKNSADVFQAFIYITRLFNRLIKTYGNTRMYTCPFFFFYYTLIILVQSDKEAECSRFLDCTLQNFRRHFCFVFFRALSIVSLITRSLQVMATK